MYDTVVAANAEANSVLAVALSELTKQVVNSIKENKPVAIIGDTDIFKANQRAEKEYKRMVGVNM